MNEEKLLTFELNSDGDEMEIHCDEKGLLFLRNKIDYLLKNAKMKSEHIHLMTKSWGGNELTEDKQSTTSILLNKVTFHVWRSS